MKPYFALILTLCWVTFTLNAQTIVPLVLDVTEEGNLTPENPRLTYAFASDPSDIQIEILASSGLIPSYTLTDANNALIAQNANATRSPILSDSATLGQTALYLITLEGVEGTLGNFTLIVRSSVSTPAVINTSIPADASNPPVPDTRCETIVEQSIDIIDNICQNTGRNEVCYGNINVLVDARNNATVNFSQQGDIIPLALVDTLLLSPLNPDTNEWGVALMQLQADLPDTVPGQNVAVLIFGNVQVQDAIGTGSNMQSFYFTPGTGTSRCNQVDADGILIRTPEGSGIVNLRVNEVDIALGSTAFLTIEPNRTLDVIMLEGIAQVSARDGVQLAGAGQKVSVPVDGAGLPSAPPNFPEPVNLEDYEALPVAGLVESAPQPSQPVPTLQAPIAPPAGGEDARPVLPVGGDCILRTFEDTEVNVRRAPDGDVVGFIRPDRLYEVTGTNDDATWYQLATPLGWVAGFVTERGGDCLNLPVIRFATPTPLPTATPDIMPTLPAPMETDPLYVNVGWLAPKATYRGDISTFNDEEEDSLYYTFVNVPMGATGKQFEVNISCTAPAGAMVFYDYGGSVGACTGTNANFAQLGDFEMNNSGAITIFIDDASPPANVTWSITLGFSGNLP